VQILFTRFTFTTIHVELTSLGYNSVSENSFQTMYFCSLTHIDSFISTHKSAKDSMDAIDA